MNSISVVIPVFNSSHSLSELYSRLVNILQQMAVPFEIIMVDDASKDDSFEVMQNLRQHDKRVGIIKLEKNYGQHAATLCGLAQSRGDYIITIDDDLQHLPEAIPDLMKKITEGYDAVFAIFENKQHSFYRNIGSDFMNLTLNMIFNKPRSVRTSSYRILTGRLANIMKEHDYANVYLAALIFKNTSKVANISIEHQKRQYGQSNYNYYRLFKLARTLFYNYSNLPILFTLIVWIVAFGMYRFVKINDILNSSIIVMSLILLVPAIISIRVIISYYKLRILARRFPPYTIHSIDMEEGELI